MSRARCGGRSTVGEVPTMAGEREEGVVKIRVLVIFNPLAFISLFEFPCSFFYFFKFLEKSLLEFNLSPACKIVQGI